MTKKTAVRVNQLAEGNLAATQELPTKVSKKAVGKSTTKTKGSAKPPLAAVGPVEAALAMMPPPRNTKILALRRSLNVHNGASLAALMEQAGWQAHTVRAALSGLRKKGWAVTRRREGADTLYAIDPESPIPDSESDVVDVVEVPASGLEQLSDPDGKPSTAGDGE